MHPSRPRREDFRRLFALALPVILAQFGLMGMSVVHTIMVGHASAADLAAAALGNLYYMTSSGFGWGVLMALDPIVSQAVGARDGEGTVRGVQRGVLLGVIVSLITLALLIPARAVFVATRQPAEVVPLAVGYLEAAIPGVLPLTLFMALRQSLQAMRRMTPIVIAVIGANVLNAAFGWAFIFGGAGCPRLGAVGAGVAASIARWGLLLLMIAFGWRSLWPLFRHWRRDSLAPMPLLRMFSLGAPIGVQLALEIGVFSVVGLMMGPLGTATVAAHQVAINIASLCYMVPLGISGAAAVLVGQAIGGHDPHRARRAAGAALFGGAGIMGLVGLWLALAPHAIARTYTPDPDVVDVTAKLLVLAALFQVFDAIQSIGIGILRGTGDTRVPMVVNLVGYWVLGLPASLLFGFTLGGGAVGMWWGLVVGLAAVAAIILARVVVRLRGDLRRVQIDEPVVAPATP